MCSGVRSHHNALEIRTRKTEGRSQKLSEVKSHRKSEVVVVSEAVTVLVVNDHNK